jgi:hypothetical protein
VRASSAKPEWLLALVVLGLIHLGFSRTFGQQNQTNYGSLLRESSLSSAHVRRDLASQERSTTRAQLTNPRVPTLPRCHVPWTGPIFNFGINPRANSELPVTR